MDRHEFNEEELRQRLYSDGNGFADWLAEHPRWKEEAHPHMVLVLEALKLEPGTPIDTSFLVSLWMQAYGSARLIQSLAADNGFESVARMFGVGAGILVSRLHAVGVGLN